MENIEKVYEALKKAGQPLKAGDLADQTGIDKKEVSKLIKKLMEDGKVHSPKFCFYSPK